MANKTNEIHPFKNHRMPLSMKLFFGGVTLTFKVLGAVSPKLAGRLALYFFMRPPQFGTPKREQALREEASLSHCIVQDRKISVRHWGETNNPKVLLSHGWGGRCTQLHAFIKPLVEAGYCVVGFDIPAHGDSEGSYSNMLDTASITQKLAQQEGDLEAIIGHSFGAATTLLAMNKYKVKAKKVILVSCFADINLPVSLFGGLFALRQSTMEAMKEYAVKKLKHHDFNWTWDQISPTNTIKSNTADILLIHDKDDFEVPYDNVEALQAAAPHAKIMTTSKLGHRKILMSKKVVNATIEFVKK